MNTTYSKPSVKFILAGIFAIIVVANVIYYFHEKGGEEKESVMQQDSVVPWNVPDINSLPDGEFKDHVTYGRELMDNTGNLVGPNAENDSMKFAGNNLICSNCHFDAGTAPNTYNLVGVTSRYPQYSQRLNAMEDIQHRINDCFLRSMNGNPLPLDSREMNAFVSYFQFISQNVPKGFKVEYEGMDPIPPLNRDPDIGKGNDGYIRHCETCHGGTGEGAFSREFTSMTPKYIIPPLWGDDSYNTGAGMSQVKTAAQFLYYKMPFTDQGSLTLEEAYDIAAYINSQPRPKFKD